MNLNIDKQYKYITYYDSEGAKVDGPLQIIYSDKVNNDLLAMMFAKNVGDNTIIANSMVYSNLTPDEVSVLSRVSCMQLDQDNDLVNLYEYKSLLDTMMVTVIDIPENVYTIHLQNDLESDEGIIENLESMTDSRKLLMIVQSPNSVENLSSEIHNMMMTPHYNTDELVLFDTDMNNYIRQSVLTDDNTLVQSGIKLGSDLDEYQYDADMQYIKGIWDTIGDKYVWELNGKARIL